MHELLEVFDVINELVEVCFLSDCFVFTPSPGRPESCPAGVT